MSFKFNIFLFFALLWVSCNSISIFETCYKKYPPPDISQLDAKAIVKDVEGFRKNFAERYNEVKMFIKNNMSQSINADVQFYLFTQKDWKKPEHLNENSLKKSHFDHKHPIKVLVHGLQPAGEKDHGTEALRHALLFKGEHNVIVMKYPKVGSMPYTQAIKHSFLVAKKAADFLHHLLKTFKITASHLHLIGFEIGGQLVGNMGHLIPGLARITALDPSGVLFNRFSDEHRISDDDAVFVDIIHTSIKSFPRGLGLTQAAGHQDFYPNGGKNQPGCPHNITAEQAGGREEAEFKNAICDNERALELFTESVCDVTCEFRGRECNSYRSFTRFHCLPFIGATKVMGFNAKKDPNLKKHTKFYLNTNKQYPYCKYF